MVFVSDAKLPFLKLMSIETDVAPAVVGRTSGLVALGKKSEVFSDILNYHCIIH